MYQHTHINLVPVMLNLVSDERWGLLTSAKVTGFTLITTPPEFQQTTKKVKTGCLWTLMITNTSIASCQPNKHTCISSWCIWVWTWMRSTFKWGEKIKINHTNSSSFHHHFLSAWRRKEDGEVRRRRFHVWPLGVARDLLLETNTLFPFSGQYPAPPAEGVIIHVFHLRWNISDYKKWGEGCVMQWCLHWHIIWLLVVMLYILVFFLLICSTH